MRAYKTRPWLWCATSLVVFIVIGFVARFDTKGSTISLARSLVEWFSGMASDHDQFSFTPFLYLFGWVVSAVAVGWFLHSVLTILMSRCEKSRSVQRTGSSEP